VKRHVWVLLSALYVVIGVGCMFDGDNGNAAWCALGVGWCGWEAWRR
jgi:hypothetical protein